MSVQSRWNHHARGVDVERAQPLERGEPAPRLGAGVGELAPPGRDRLADADGLVHAGLGRDRPAHARQLVDESRALRELVGVGVRVRRDQHDAAARPPEHHPEQAPLVLQPFADLLGPAPDPLQRSQVEHRLRPRQRREVPLGGAGHQHGVELQAARAVGREHLHGVEHGDLARAPARPVLAGVERLEERLHPGVALFRRLGHDVGERDGGVELLPARLDQSCGARQLLPQDLERVLHRHAREQRRLVQRGARAFDP